MQTAAGSCSVGFWLTKLLPDKNEERPSPITALPQHSQNAEQYSIFHNIWCRAVILAFPPILGAVHDFHAWLLMKPT